MNIELRNIHKHFGPVHANNDISVTLNEGRIVGVLGENGAGKSTLMKILSGYQPADSGAIYIDGREVDYSGPQAAIGHGVGMLQQDPLDVGAFTVLENFMYGRDGGRKSPDGTMTVSWRDRLFPRRNEAGEQLQSLTQRFGFELDPETPIEQLSIAQRQQLEIVRLLALGVKTLILDEPTTGISAEQKDILFQALRDLAEQDGMIVLLVSHKLEDVIALCDEVFVLRNGLKVGEMVLPEHDIALTSAQIATTKGELVHLMFGEELPPAERARIELGEPVLVLDNLHLQNKRLNMANVSLTVRAGEVIGLAGLDGSGQSLLMRAAAGLEKTQSGKITLNGRDMTQKPYRQFMGGGLIFGAAGRLEEGLIAGLTLTEHMALVMDQKRVVDWKQADTHMQSQIQHFNVRGQTTDNIEQLSGGNQQRVLMALLPENPSVLVLEQPTRGLDVESARWIWKQLLERCQTGAAILFSSAELDELVAYSDRILVFYAGYIYEVPDVGQTTIDELGHLIGGEFER